MWDLRIDQWRTTAPNRVLRKGNSLHVFDVWGVEVFLAKYAKWAKEKREANPFFGRHYVML